MKKIIQFMLLICFSLLAPQSMAQDRPTKTQPTAEAPQWLHITVMRVKPELVTEFVDFQKNETIPALKKAGVTSRDVWVTGVFGESFEYVFVTPIEKFAQYDSPSPIVRALGEEGARAYGAKLRRFLTSQHSYAVRMRPDLSYQGKMTWPPKLAVVSWNRVAPGRSMEYEAYIKNDVLPAMKKAEVAGFLVSQTTFGGNGNEYVSLVLRDNFAHLDKGPPAVQALGQEGANRLSQKTAGLVTNTERSIAHYNPDLSIAPTQIQNK